jgi:hypothetical protein
MTVRRNDEGDPNVPVWFAWAFVIFVFVIYPLVIAGLAMWITWK